MDHGEVVGGAFLVARGDPAKLLEAVDEALDEIAPLIGHTVELGLPALVALARDDCANVPLPEAAPHSWAAVALVASGPPRPQAGSALSGATDRALVQQRFKGDLFVPLAAGQSRRCKPFCARVDRTALRP